MTLPHARKQETLKGIDGMNDSSENKFAIADYYMGEFGHLDSGTLASEVVGAGRAWRRPREPPAARFGGSRPPYTR